LKSDEVSYLILLPRFNARNNKRPYITVLTNKAAEYKHYVESGRYLAASSYFSMMQGILEGSGQEDTARKTRLEALAVMIGLYSQGRRERGTFSQRILNNMKERLMDQFKAGQEQKLKAGQITQGQYESLVNEMETLLDNTFVTWKGEVPQVFIKSTEGNFMYAVEAEKVEGETKPVVMLAAYDGISGKKIESVKLESQIMEAELAAGEAIDMGKELLARVQKLKNEQFLKRFGIEAKAQLEIEILKGKLADAEDLQEWLETKLTKMANAMRVDKGQVEAEAQKIISSRVEELTATLARAREGEVSPAKRVGEAVATRKAADDLEKEVRASKEFQDLVAKAEEQKPSDMMGSIKVVKHDFKGTGVAAFNYREGERTGILKEGRTLVVALNQSYIDEAVKMLEAAGITEITVTVVERRRKKEVKMSVREALEQELIDHEKKEDHWVAKRKVGERRGHILASAETALTWRAKELGGLSLFHYIELKMMGFEQLEALAREDRTDQHKILKSAKMDQAIGYEENMQKAAREEAERKMSPEVKKKREDAAVLAKKDAVDKVRGVFVSIHTQVQAELSKVQGLIDSGKLDDAASLMKKIYSRLEDQIKAATGKVGKTSPEMLNEKAVQEALEMAELAPNALNRELLRSLMNRDAGAFLTALGNAQKGLDLDGRPIKTTADAERAMQEAKRRQEAAYGSWLAAGYEDLAFQYMRRAGDRYKDRVMIESLGREIKINTGFLLFDLIDAVNGYRQGKVNANVIMLLTQLYQVSLDANAEAKGTKAAKWADHLMSGLKNAQERAKDPKDPLLEQRKDKVRNLDIGSFMGEIGGIIKVARGEKAKAVEKAPAAPAAAAEIETTSSEFASNVMKAVQARLDAIVGKGKIAAKVREYIARNYVKVLGRRYKAISADRIVPAINILMRNEAEVIKMLEEAQTRVLEALHEEAVKFYDEKIAIHVSKAKTAADYLQEEGLYSQLRTKMQAAIEVRKKGAEAGVILRESGIIEKMDSLETDGIKMADDGITTAQKRRAKLAEAEAKKKVAPAAPVAAKAEADRRAAEAKAEADRKAAEA
ncbi:MAG: hypothetical protein WBC16_00950, partial [Candidatus Omnitrophota bacterium]